MSVGTRGAPAIEAGAGYRTKAGVAADILRRAILSGELAPGEPLTVGPLAERYGLTLMPLREAIARLASEDLVELDPHRTARVARLDHDRMNEEYAVRAVLEAAAAAQAVPHLDAKALAELEDLLRRMDRARDARRTADYWALTKQFHERIYEATPSRLLRDEVDRVRVRTLRYLSVFAKDQDLVHTAQREHWRILDAIKAGDPEDVEQLVREHVATVARSAHLPGERPQHRAVADRS